MADAEKGAQYLDAQAQKKPKLLALESIDENLSTLWDRGLPPGDPTGWASVDKHYTVLPGQMTIVTGWPGSGKSEWLDALLLNLARHHGWKIAVFSPENQPVELHVAKLLEKVTGKPFGRGPTERMSKEEMLLARGQLQKWFGFIEPPSEDALTVQDVIEAAAPFLLTAKKRGLVVDPWNELEHWRPNGLSETEYISKTLTYVRNWARKTGVHVWIVAHPQKLRRENGELPVPKPDMISGSQHWWNKADNAIAVWRDLSKPDNREVQIHVHKVRFKHTGRPGLVSLDYDRVTGRYFEQPAYVQAQANRYAERDE